MSRSNQDRPKRAGVDSSRDNNAPDTPAARPSPIGTFAAVCGQPRTLGGPARAYRMRRLFANLYRSMEGGSVAELLDVAVERPAFGIHGEGHGIHPVGASEVG
jgi:hypothetical protein